MRTDRQTDRQLVQLFPNKYLVEIGYFVRQKESKKEKGHTYVLGSIRTYARRLLAEMLAASRGAAGFRFLLSILRRCFRSCMHSKLYAL